MYIRINEISREPALDAPLVRGLYLDIDFWLTQIGYNNGNPPILSEDFSMQIWIADRTITQDINGNYLTTGGQSIDPATLTPDSNYVWQYTTTPRTAVQIIAQIRANIAKLVNMATQNSMIRGERRFRRWVIRTQTDADNILANIAALKNYSGAS